MHRYMHEKCMLLSSEINYQVNSQIQNQMKLQSEQLRGNTQDLERAKDEVKRLKHQNEEDSEELNQKISSQTKQIASME